MRRQQDGGPRSIGNSLATLAGVPWRAVRSVLQNAATLKLTETGRHRQRRIDGVQSTERDRDRLSLQTPVILHKACSQVALTFGLQFGRIPLAVFGTDHELVLSMFVLVHSTPGEPRSTLANGARPRACAAHRSRTWPCGGPPSGIPERSSVGKSNYRAHRRATAV